MDILLDVRNFIGRKHKNTKHKGNALRSIAIKKGVDEMKGTQDCVAFLIDKIDNLLLTKEQIVVVIGCKQGRHRSVTVAISLKDKYADKVEIIYHYIKS